MSDDETEIGRMKAALHDLRVEFAEWQLREFPLFGFDAIKQMGIRGLCTQEEANAAIKEAAARIPNYILATTIATCCGTQDRPPPRAGRRK